MYITSAHHMSRKKTLWPVFPEKDFDAAKIGTTTTSI